MGIVDRASDFDRTRLGRAPRIRSLRVGELKVSYVPDGLVRLKPRGWLPAADDADWAAYSDHLDDSGHLVAGIGGLLVERDDRALLIDTGFGPEAHPDDPANPLLGELYGGELLNSLRRLGREPRQIEAVAITHLHPDHLGWAWSTVPGDDQPPFAHAAYLVAAPEWERRDLPAEGGASEDRLSAMATNVRTIGDGEGIFPGVHASLAPGHTIGHTMYTIDGGDQRLIAFGDALHYPSRSLTQNGRAVSTMTLLGRPRIAAVWSPSWADPTRSDTAATSPMSCSDAKSRAGMVGLPGYLSPDYSQA